MTNLLTERLRPQTLDDVIGQEDNIKRLKAYVKAKDMPHLRMQGPAGTGKTSSAFAFIKDLYGEGWQDNRLYLNASDERGIDTIRDSVIKFAQIQSYNDVGFKVVMLDEADGLTRDSQDILRNVMEQYAFNTRFILICNYPHKIKKAIKSRTFPMIFGPLTKEEVIEGIRKIGIEIDDESVERIAQYSRGSLRDAINIIDGIMIATDKVTKEDVESAIGAYDKEVVRELFGKCINGNMKDTSELLCKLLYKSKMNELDIIHCICDIIDEEPYSNKFGYYKVLADTEWRISQNGSIHIQLKSMIAQLAELSQ